MLKIFLKISVRYNYSSVNQPPSVDVPFAGAVA